MDYTTYITSRQSANETGKATLFQKAKDLENEDRRCFSQARDGWEVAGREDLSLHPHKSLIPLYGEKDGKALSTFKIDPPTADDANPMKRAFPHSRAEREALTGQLSVVPSLNEFRATFLDVFCEGLLRYVNWDNVFAAGGGVLACAQPIPEEHAISHATKRKYFHDLKYASSDVDLFLYGLDEMQAKAKLVEIYNAVCESCPHTVVCFRSAHAVTLVSQYPFRHIQIVLRLYSSPYEVLAGFDVDACTIGFDGKMVYADVRAHHALVTRRNTIDVTRRSPSYEMRLAKYGTRGFEVEVDDLKRDLIDPSIFERPWASLEGLAKLLVLEKLRTPEQRQQFFDMQKMNREGGSGNNRYRGWRRHRAVDSSTQERIEEQLGGTAEISNYSTVFLPWGPGVTCESTMRLMAKKDLKLNSKWFMRDRIYRLHPCFFGTAEEILEDCSKDDPPFPPKREPEDPKVKEHRETYVRGPLQFITDDPGRQRIGSFHPLSEKGWAEGVYFHESTEELFAASNANDVQRVLKALETVANPDIRDFFGRTPLHLALIAGAVDVARALLKIGANPLQPMAGGRTVFHLAAIYGHEQLIPELRDAAEKTFLKQFEEGQAGGKNSEDNEEEEAAGLLGEEEADDEKDKTGNKGDDDLAKRARTSCKQLVRARDGDASLSAFQMALVFGRLDCARALLKAGAVLHSDPAQTKEPEPTHYGLVSLLPDAQLEEGVKFLVEHGYSCAKRQNNPSHSGYTELMGLVVADDVRAVEVLSKYDPDFKKACRTVSTVLELPITHAVLKRRNAEMVRILLENGDSPTDITPEMVFEAKQFAGQNHWSLHNFQENDVPLIGRLAHDLIEEMLFFCTQCKKGPDIGAHIVLVRSQQRESLIPSDEDEKPFRNLLSILDEDARFRNIQNMGEIFRMLAEKTRNLDQKLTRFLSWEFSNMNSVQEGNGFNPAYWENLPNYDGPKPGHQQFAVNAREFVAWLLGGFYKFYDAVTKEKPISVKSKITQPMFVKLCESLEKGFGGKATMIVEQLRMWKTATELSDNTTRDAMLRDMESKLRAQTDAVIKERMNYLLDIAEKMTKSLNCPKEIIEFYRDPSQSFFLSPHYSYIPQGAKENSFPTCSELFKQETTHPEERPIRAYLEQQEMLHPAPNPLPHDPNPEEPWAIAGMQRSLFRLLARQYSAMVVTNLKRQYYHNLDYTFYTTEAGYHQKATAYPAEYQEEVGSLFHLCYSGSAADLIAKSPSLTVPIASVDKEGRSPLTMAILARNAEMTKEIFNICHKRVDKVKKKKKLLNERMDNFELMNEMEMEEEYSEEEYSDDGEDDGDYDDGDDEEIEDEEEGEDSDEAEKNEDEEKNLLLPNAKPEMLLSVMCSLPLTEITFGKQAELILRQYKEYYETVVPNAGTSSVAKGITPAVRVTPIQLAVLVDAPDVLRQLLEEAKKISYQMVRDLFQHQSIYVHRSDVADLWKMAISMDRVDCLRVMVQTAGFALPLEKIETKLQLSGSWKFRAPEGAKKIEPPKKKKAAEDEDGEEGAEGRGAEGRYQGLQSSMYGTGKQLAALRRNPRRTRLTRLPYPESTLVHFAAHFGACNVFKYLTGESGHMMQDVKVAVGGPDGESFRELVALARTAAPKAFQTEFGADVSVEADSRVFIYFLLGGKQDARDESNLQPIHYAIKNEMLGVLIDNGIKFEASTRPWKKGGNGLVTEEDKIRFKQAHASARGLFTAGGSPMSLAAILGQTQTCLRLIDDLGFDPSIPDEYVYGMTPFHLALDGKHWETAKVLASRLKPADLVRPSKTGITPLMTAAKSGTVQALLACCESARSDIVNSVLQVSDEGTSALHLAASARFSETLKTLMEWTANLGGQKQWFVEDYMSGRTPHDHALSAVLNQESYACSVRGAHIGLARDKYRLMKEKRGEEQLVDGRKVLDMVTGALNGTSRIRAKFEQAQPARAKVVDAVAGNSEANAPATMKDAIESYAAIWGEDARRSDYGVFSTEGYQYVNAFDIFCTVPYHFQIYTNLLW